MAKRKKPTVMTMERRTMLPDEVKNMRVACAWDGCTRSRPIKEMQPPDWHNLIVYWSPFLDPKKTLEQVCTGPSCYRDAVLCPEHAKALDGLLKDLGRELQGPPEGTA